MKIKPQTKKVLVIERKIKYVDKIIDKKKEKGEENYLIKYLGLLKKKYIGDRRIYIR